MLKIIFYSGRPSRDKVMVWCHFTTSAELLGLNMKWRQWYTRYSYS